eukprot:TRINITY_DN6758_c0_g1_i1.p1 TRINITY_DN6758_c0_g1~~TRINITY_DN6758_c0_g1_i1.p1  ORF type:complete len:216 (+),score=37.65 TRINITY_DN6758_c0_g1_i1:99-746(+)
MPELTLIARISDSLILCSSLEYVERTNNQEISQQAKDLLKKFTPNSPPSMHLDSGPWYFTYLIKGDVVFLTVSEKGYPKSLSLKFLDELSREFDLQYGQIMVGKAKRPYEFLKFETFISKTKKLYSDVRVNNLTKVTEGLNDVQKIMSRNITEILGRGEKLESVAKKSEKLADYSAKLKSSSKSLNAGHFWRTYAPLIVVVMIFVIVLGVRFYFF